MSKDAVEAARLAADAQGLSLMLVVCKDGVPDVSAACPLSAVSEFGCDTVLNGLYETLIRGLRDDLNGSDGETFELPN